MKLLQRTNKYYIFYSVITYLIIAITFFLVIDYAIRRDVEERLKVERRDFESYIKANGTWSNSCYFVENKIELTKQQPVQVNLFKDTVILNKYTGDLVPFREINFFTKIGTESYKVSIRKSLIESEELLIFITGTMLITVSIGLLILFLFQRKMAKKLWQPFYHSLTQAKAFDVKNNQSLSLSTPEILEFRELNDVLDKMTQKMQKDYKSLKEFTENASHEIQTPLALINGRIEQLIQQKNLSEQQMYWIEEIHNSSLRLSRLNNALLLLTKIDNDQFDGKQIVDLNRLTLDKFSYYEDILLHKNIRLKVIANDTFEILINPDLADILVNNLVGNAVKHNWEEGIVEVEIKKSMLTIKNSGKNPMEETSKLFDRFKKDKSNPESIGLGLAIVKKICDNNYLKIVYKFESGFHTISLSKY